MNNWWPNSNQVTWYGSNTTDSSSTYTIQYQPVFQPATYYDPAKEAASKREDERHPALKWLDRRVDEVVAMAAV